MKIFRKNSFIFPLNFFFSTTTYTKKLRVWMEITGSQKHREGAAGALVGHFTARGIYGNRAGAHVERQGRWSFVPIANRILVYREREKSQNEYQHYAIGPHTVHRNKNTRRANAFTYPVDCCLSLRPDYFFFRPFHPFLYSFLLFIYDVYDVLVVRFYFPSVVCLNFGEQKFLLSPQTWITRFLYLKLFCSFLCTAELFKKSMKLVT